MLNEALRLVRVYHDLNKTQVAEKVGLSKSFITQIEAGDRKVTLDVLEKYASAFKLPVSSLMLFAERAEDNSLADTARFNIAGKVINMLSWLAEITEETPAS